MRTRARAILVVATLAACQFDTSFELDTHVDPERPASTFTEACRQNAAAACAYTERCDPRSFGISWPDRATCEERTTISCELRLTDTHVREDEEWLRDCAATADLPCPENEDYAAVVAAFQERCPALRGDLPLGSACSTTSACAEGTCSWLGQDPAALCGVCAAEPQPCGEDCTFGEHCVMTREGSSICVPLNELGTSCADSTECASNSCVRGSCAPPVELDGPCDPSRADGSICEHDLICSFKSRCESLVLAEEGDRCGILPDERTAACRGGMQCIYRPEPTCVRPVGDGDLCDPMEGAHCLFPAECIAGYCRFHSVDCAPPS